MPEEILEHSLAIMGDEDLVLGFKALGFNLYPVKERRDFQAALSEILDKKCSVCLVQDDVYTLAREEIANYKNLALPIFIPFSKTGGMDLLDRMIKYIKLRATGTLQ
jgi:vacuolar-type H+-ATPase subunit F/Vma7